MKISDIMTEENIAIGIKANTKREVLDELSYYAAKVSGFDRRTIFDSLLERENLGSTGFGNATALPHGRFATLPKTFAILAKLNTPVDFDAIDGKPVDLIFALLSPEDSGADHLTALAKISRILKDESMCSKLRQITSNEDIYALLNSNE